MVKRIMSLVLVLAMSISICLSFSTLAHAYNPSDDDIIDAVLVIFRCKEGTYDSVNRNDNGALSIGKLQWHAQRALELMKEIVNQNSEIALSMLGDQLYMEVVSALQGDWNNRILSPEEAACFSALLATDLSKSIQDALGRKDISSYVIHARRLNIQDPTAIVYFCDLQNQYGPGGAENLLQKVKSRIGHDAILSLDDLHYNLLQVTGNYHARRNWTYQYCSSLDWMNLGYYKEYNVGVIDTNPTIALNLDLQPPKISEANIIGLSSGVFQVEIKATDDRKINDCRVEIGSNVSSDSEVALYGKCIDNIWITRVLVDRFSSSATKYYVTVTVSDESGNGSSTHLEVSKAELDAVHLSSDSKVHTHRYCLLFETKATDLTPACRVDQCIECHVMKSTIIAPANGICFEQQS